MTLEDIKAEFRALQVLRLGELRTGKNISESVIESWAAGNDHAWGDHEDRAVCNKMVQVARLYVIARDQGMDAAVVWKLGHTDNSEGDREWA